MTPTSPPSIERLYELLATQATQPLTSTETEELRTLQAKWPHVDADELELAAAAIFAATAPLTEPLSPNLLKKIERGSDEHFGVVELRTPRDVRPGRRIANSLGWPLAACFLLSTTLLSWRLYQPDRGSMSLAEQRRELLARSASRFVSADGKSEALWDGATQRGVMRLSGLDVNDPTRTQYQLWIVDAGRSHPEPVDGGVFDVTTGDVLIPIQAALNIRSPKLFAVTTEPPGGVVVSERGRRGEFVAVMSAAPPQ